MNQVFILFHVEADDVSPYSSVRYMAVIRSPKPRYRHNPAHSARAPLPGKTPEPADAERIYIHASISCADCGGFWYGIGGNTHIYRFSPTNDGTVHFSGMTGGPQGIRFESIPIEVRRALGRIR